MANMERIAAYGLVIATFVLIFGIIASPVVSQFWGPVGEAANQAQSASVTRGG